jgi:hypothetical protein
MHGAIPAHPHTSSWHDVYLSTGYIFMVWYLDKHRDNFTFTVFFRTFQIDVYEKPM